MPLVPHAQALPSRPTRPLLSSLGTDCLRLALTQLAPSPRSPRPDPRSPHHPLSGHPPPSHWHSSRKYTSGELIHLPLCCPLGTPHTINNNSISNSNNNNNNNNSRKYIATMMILSHTLTTWFVRCLCNRYQTLNESDWKPFTCVVLPCEADIQCSVIAMECLLQTADVHI